MALGSLALANVALATEQFPCPATTQTCPNDAEGKCPIYDPAVCPADHAANHYQNRCTLCPKSNSTTTNPCLRATTTSNPASCALPPSDFCPGGDWFTIAMLGDTQRYTNNRPCIFDCETEWIKANKDVFRIKYALQVGDITDDGDSDLEFSRAKKSMCVLNGTNVETPIVPYSLARGNHDNLTDYNRYFPLEMYNKWCANDNCIVTPNGGVEFSAHPFTAGGGDWLVVLLDWTPPTTANPPGQPEASPSLEFANWIVDQSANANKRVIVMTHAFLHLDGEHYETNIWDDFADQHRNVFFIFSGHYPNNFGPSVAQRVATNSQGNRVFQLVADHQSDPDRDGTVELLTICPSPGRVLVKSYSPFFDRCFTSADGDPDFQFEWPPTTPPIDFSLACGDGFVGGSEQCDDGNTSSADCCSSTCTCQVGASGACTCGLTCGQAGSLCKCGY